MYTSIPPEANDDEPHHPGWGHAGTGRATIGFRYASAVLRTARAYAELSQRELAERTGISYATISRIEGNHGSPRWSTVERCVRACGFRFALINEEGEVIDYAPLILARDRAGRHYPSHLRVWFVTKSTQWWNGGGRQTRLVPLSECPPYSFTRYRVREPDAEDGS